MTESGPPPDPDGGRVSGEGEPVVVPEPRRDVRPVEAQGTAGPAAVKDPLRGSKASGLWAGVVALVVLLVLLAVFVLQNTQSVEVEFFGWEGDAPLAAALLIAVAAGLLIAVVAGSLRILQLRRRVRREQKR